MNAGKNIGGFSMRVFLDTKSDQLRVELAQGAVSKTYAASGQKKGDRGLLEIDVAVTGEVIELRIAPLSELLGEFKLKEKA